MKKLLIFALLFFVTGFVKSQIPFQSRPTAFTIDKREFEISLFSPTRYGVGKKTEVFSSIFADWKLPNAGVKHLWYKKPSKNDNGFFRERDIFFGTVHNIDYPTMLFKSIQDHKPDYISDTCTVPNVITLRNELRVSFLLKKRTSCNPSNFLFTLRTGIKNSFKIKKDATMPPVDKMIWYRETVVCLDTIVWFAGVDLDFHIGDYFNMLVDCDFYSVDWGVKDFSVENKIFLYAYFGMRRRVMIEAGVKFAYGTIYSENKFLALPMIDFSYFWKLKKKRDRGLFPENMF